MAIARLHGGPLDGQVLPLDDESQDTLILPYSETQVVYELGAAPETDGDEGPSASHFHFVQSEDSIDPDPDDDDRRNE